MSDIKLQDEIVLGGEKLVIQKLKAGKFWKAQKVFAEIIASAGPTGADENDLAQLQNLMSKFPEKIAEFVAICADMDIKDIEEKAYPEEISKAFGICAELNNVIENIKNSVAPMEKLMKGAEPAKR